MAHKHRSRPDQGRLGCDRLPGASHPCHKLLAMQAQFLIAAHRVQPELAAMVAAMAFGGGLHHGC